MNISNLGRLIAAGLLALGLHAFAPGTAAGDADRTEPGSVNGSEGAEPSRSARASAP